MVSPTNLRDENESRMENVQEKLTIAIANLANLQGQFTELRAVVNRLNEDHIERRKDVEHLRELLEQQMEDILAKITVSQQNIVDLQKELRGMSGDRGFLKFLKNWSSYIGLLIVSILIIALFHLIMNNQSSPKQKPTVSPSHVNVSPSKSAPSPAVGPYSDLNSASGD